MLCDEENSLIFHLPIIFIRNIFTLEIWCSIARIMNRERKGNGKSLFVSATRRRRDIKILLCLSAPLQKSCRANLVKKNQNCQCNLKFGTKTNSNMQNLMVVIHFFCFRPETPFWGKFGPKNQNFHFKLKFGT